MNKGKESKKMSIRSMLILTIIPVVLLMVAAFFILATKEVSKQTEQNLELASNVYAEKIDAWATGILEDMQIYKDAIEDGGFESDDEILEFMEISVDKKEAYPIGLYMGDDKGHYLDASGWVPDDDWVLVERDWYREGITHEELQFGEPYYDAQSGQVCISVTSKVKYEDPEATRVLAVDTYLDYISSLMKDFKIGRSGQAFLVTNESMKVLAHPDDEMIDRALTDSDLDVMYKNIADVMTKGQNGLVQVSGNNGTYYVNIKNIPSADWTFVTFESKKDAFAGLYRLEIIMLVVSVIAAVVLIAACTGLMGKVVKPINKAANALTDVAKGDFSKSLEVSGGAEIAEMTRNMKVFIDNMRDIIGDLQKTSGWLSEQAADNEKMSGELMILSQEQEKDIETLSTATASLSQSAEELSAQMLTLVGHLDEACLSGKDADDLMQETVKMSKTGQESMDGIKSGMNNIEDSITRLSAQMQKCDEATKQINEMVDIISGIAEETNLLSLNASIEAARAGEAGRGFAVVAEEIGKLALSSSEAAGDISKHTEEIVSTVADAMEQTKASVEVIKESSQLVSEAGATFEDVFGKVSRSGDMVSGITDTIRSVTGIANDVSVILNAQVASAKDINDVAGNIESSAKTFTQNSKDMSATAQEFRDEATKLSDRIMEFKL